MASAKIYCGILNRHIHTKDEISFSIVKMYANMEGMKYLLLRIHSADIELIVARKPHPDESRGMFKHSSVIDRKDEFYILLKSVLDEKAADQFIGKYCNRSKITKGGISNERNFY